MDFPDKKFYSTRNGNDIFSSQLLDSIWQLGECKIGEVTFDSCAYVARYIVGKKLGEASEYYKQHSIEPEFVVMSRRPGIGASWLAKYRSDVFPRDYTVIRGGIKARPPSYYLDLYERENPDKVIEIKAKRLEHAEKNPNATSKMRLKAREIIRAKRMDKITRHL